MDGILDIIIAVLFIAIPAIFKAIGNKLEKSGSDKAGQFKKIAEAFEDNTAPDEEDAESEVESDTEPEGKNFWDMVRDEWGLEVKPVDEPEPEPVQMFEKPAEVVEKQIKRPAMLIEEEPEKKGEKIDPKKLVIYSEIMKPKF